MLPNTFTSQLTHQRGHSVPPKMHARIFTSCSILSSHFSFLPPSYFKWKIHLPFQCNKYMDYCFVYLNISIPTVHTGVHWILSISLSQRTSLLCSNFIYYLFTTLSLWHHTSNWNLHASSVLSLQQMACAYQHNESWKDVYLWNVTIQEVK